LVNPNEQHGSAEPHEGGADQPSSADNQRLDQIRLRIWRVANWPQQWWRGGNHSRRAANFTVLLALGTLALAGVNIGMLLAMRSGAEQQHIDTLESNRISREAFTAVQRAFIVSIAFNESKEDTPKENAFRFTPVFRNTGNTPAINVSIFSVTARDYRVFLLAYLGDDMAALERTLKKSTTVGASVDPEKLLGFYQTHSETPGGPLFAYAIIKNTYLSPQVAFSPSIASGVVSDYGESLDNVLQRMIRGGMDKFFIGVIHYDDMFGQSHVTKYCYAIAGVTGNPLKFNWGQCTHWNCIDADCERDAREYDNEFAKASDQPGPPEWVRRMRERYGAPASPAPTPQPPK
jgi:hypothetical protein